MLQRSFILCAAFWLPTIGGLSDARELPDNTRTYLAGKARLLTADAALRFDADVQLNAQELRVNKKLLGLRRALTARYKKEKRFPPSQPFYAVKKEIEQAELYRFLRGIDGLSYDFWVATLAWELDLRALKQLAMNSLRYSGMTDAEKQTALTAWQQQWDAWVAAAAR